MPDLAAAYERYAVQLRRYVVCRVKDDAAADDICGDLWLEACERWGRYEDRGWPVSAWLYQIARSRMIDAYRQAQRRPTVALKERHAVTDAPGLDHLDAATQARRILAAMLPDQAQACWLRYGVGLTGDEVGARMGRSRGAVKALIVRGKEKAHAHRP